MHVFPESGTRACSRISFAHFMPADARRSNVSLTTLKRREVHKHELSARHQILYLGSVDITYCTIDEAQYVQYSTVAAIFLRVRVERPPADFQSPPGDSVYNCYARFCQSQFPHGPPNSIGFSLGCAPFDLATFSRRALTDGAAQALPTFVQHCASSVRSLLLAINITIN